MISSCVLTMRILEVGIARDNREMKSWTKLVGISVENVLMPYISKLKLKLVMEEGRMKVKEQTERWQSYKTNKIKKEENNKKQTFLNQIFHIYRTTIMEMFKIFFMLV